MENDRVYGVFRCELSEDAERWWESDQHQIDSIFANSYAFEKIDKETTIEVEYAAHSVVALIPFDSFPSIFFERNTRGTWALFSASVSRSLRFGVCANANLYQIMTVLIALRPRFHPVGKMVVSFSERSSVAVAIATTKYERQTTTRYSGKCMRRREKDLDGSSKCRCDALRTHFRCKLIG